MPYVCRLVNAASTSSKLGPYFWTGLRIGGEINEVCILLLGLISGQTCGLMSSQSVNDMKYDVQHGRVFWNEEREKRLSWIEDQRRGGDCRLEGHILTVLGSQVSGRIEHVVIVTS